MNYPLIQASISHLPAFRQRQVYKALFSDFVSDWGQVSTLPKDLRLELEDKCPLAIKAAVRESRDTLKAAIDLDGVTVESVLMRHKDRNTVCLSTQAGCPMGCSFCATGKMGFERNLAWWEIIVQALFFARRLKAEGQAVTNVVFMGMGEPFLNYDEVIKAAHKLNDQEGFNIGARRISISTVGIIPGIQKLAREKLQVNLAVSIHAPDDETRDRLMPINAQYPLEKLLEAIREYLDAAGRKVLIEYLLIDRVNDSPEQAALLAALLKSRLGGLFAVNLIKYNQTGAYLPSSRERIAAFKKVLSENRVEVVERYRFGHDIKAACGQLASGHNKFD